MLMICEMKTKFYYHEITVSYLYLNKLEVIFSSKKYLQTKQTRVHLLDYRLQTLLFHSLKELLLLKVFLSIIIEHRASFQHNRFLNHKLIQLSILHFTPVENTGNYNI